LEGILPKSSRTRPSSNWSSTSKPPRRWPWRSRSQCCCERTKWSS